MSQNGIHQWTRRQLLALLGSLASATTLPQSLLAANISNSAC